MTLEEATQPGPSGERRQVQVDDGDLIHQTEQLAQRLLTDAIGRQGRRERSQGRRIARLLDDEDGLAFVLALTDEVLRIRDPARAARHFESLVGGDRSPSFLGRVDRALLHGGAAAATRWPRIVMPLVKARVRAELASFVIAAEPRPFARHVARRHAAGTRLNVNLLGEAVLGEQEAQRRLEAVAALLRRRDVDYVSVKVSSVCSQLDIAAFDHEVDRVAVRLRHLYDEALRHDPPKFVNLDMEEYSDLDLTVTVFKRVLSEDTYAHLSAGIVLQAYIPESYLVLEDLVGWARDRHRRHGGAVKIRLVKGANLAMERVEAELAGWPQAPFATKAEVDANYKRMLDVLLAPANADAVRVGVGTHNLFEAAWALTVSAQRGLRDMLEMEMLEGMAPSIATSVREHAGGLLIYAPIARRTDTESVIAYLVRRFDENTGPENFLRHQFSLRPGTPIWATEQNRFREAASGRRSAPVISHRIQDRHQEAHPAARPGDAARRPFANEPDTDVSVSANRTWLASQLGPLVDHGVTIVPTVVAGRAVADGPLVDGIDPSEPAQVTYRWVEAGEPLVDEAVAAATGAGTRWRERSREDRRRVLFAVADALAVNRGRLIGVMARDGGKTVAEGDPEVSEAIDFARYYGDQIPGLAAHESEGARFEPFGTVVVVPPWNFPLAIPAGGVLAALAAGNAVILKPAPETVATAWVLAESCWQAGLPRDLLQFLPTADGPAGQRLIEHPDVQAVILTGSWDTARMFLGWRPDLRLHGETSGKNAIVVTATADLDGAVADIVRSAFGHAGQKCSAASLAILEASVYDDMGFRRQLADAIRSLRLGPGWELRSTMGPLIRPPEGPLEDALHRLQPGESWLVEPRQVAIDNPHLWSPGVKLGVQPGSRFHLTECFGPVLGLMRAANLDQAIAWQNQPAYGLTAGLQSLDPAEIEQWRESVQAGNLYVNRHITGAIVRRQSFGGWKRSVVGPGAKAGGPNYVASLGRWTARFGGSTDEFAAAVARTWSQELLPADPSALLAEANVFRYRRLETVLLRAGTAATDHEVALALAAARAVGVAVTTSSIIERDLEQPTIVEDDSVLARRMNRVSTDKVRLIGGAGDALRLAIHDAGLWLDDVPVVAHPAREVLRWVREQAISETRHRHGNVTDRHPGPPVADSR